MPKYSIQQRLHILAKLVCVKNGKIVTSFDIDGFTFTHWEFTLAEGAKTNYWLVEYELESENVKEALGTFHNRLALIVSKVAFISQCYCEYLDEPFIIHKKGSDIAYFRYTQDSQGVPLHFNEEHIRTLDQLINNSKIPNEFYYYWNDMLNTIGYSAKLLLLCCALEALAKPYKEKHDFLREVLGKDLHHKLWANGNEGIRHRLIHGEYFNPQKDSENYVYQAYIKVLVFFNKTIFKDDLLNTEIKSPQRHYAGNKTGTAFFIKCKENGVCYSLKELLEKASQGIHQVHSEYGVTPNSDNVDTFGDDIKSY